MRTRKLKLAKVSRVAVRIDGTKITRSYIKSLRGSLKGHGVMKAMMADRRIERAL